MTKTQMKSLMFVAAVAILPVACGTSPVGTDAAVIAAGSSVSAVRGAPGVSPSSAVLSVECLVATMAITRLDTDIGPAPAGVRFVAALSAQDGSLIEDTSCEGVTWSIDGGPASSRRPVITYNGDSRHVTITAMHGSYTIRATAPNGVRGALEVEVQ